MSTAPPNAVGVSVIVPTRGRSGCLAGCLAALERQQIAEPFEIIVVADGLDAAERVAIVVERFPRARLVRRPQEGPAAARNAGAAVALGSFICLTDDDCEPASGWLRALTASLRAGGSVAAGCTLNGFPKNRFARTSQALTDYLTEHSRVAFAASNNVGCHASVLRTSPFDERYREAAGEDRGWCTRLAAVGVPLVRVPDAVVEHRQRLSLLSFFGQQARYGRGAYVFRRSTPELRSLQAIGFYRGLVYEGFRRGLLDGLLTTASQIAVGIGFVSQAVRTHVRNSRF
jgi:glycosyltransferase involved in cell wall biosynthesis